MKSLPAMLLIVAFSAFTVTAGCSDSSPARPIPVGSVEILFIDDLAIGDAVQADAVIRDGEGGILEGRQVTWSSSEPAIAEVSATGLVTGLTAGIVEISATSEGIRGLATATVSGTAGDPCETTVGTLSFDETVEGTLDSGSCYIEAWFHDPWRVVLEEAATVQIDLTSPDFDAYLIVTDATGSQVIAQDNDSGEGTSARIIVDLQAGNYLVWATTFNDDETGSYELAIIETESVCEIEGTLALGETMTGTLGEGSCQLGDGSYIEPWILQLEEASDLVIDLVSSDFNTFLIVSDLHLDVLGLDDNSGEGTNSRLEITLGPGDYLVWVNSMSEGETGAYELTVAEAGGSASGWMTRLGEEVTPIPGKLEGERVLPSPQGPAPSNAAVRARVFPR